MELLSLGFNQKTLGFLLIIGVTIYQAYGLYTQSLEIRAKNSTDAVPVTLYIYQCFTCFIVTLFSAKYLILGFAFHGGLLLIYSYLVLKAQLHVEKKFAWYEIVLIAILIIAVFDIIYYDVISQAFLYTSYVNICTYFILEPLQIIIRRDRGVIHKSKLQSFFVSSLAFLVYSYAVGKTEMIHVTWCYLIYFGFTFFIWAIFPNKIKD